MNTDNVNNTDRLLNVGEKCDFVVSSCSKKHKRKNKDKGEYNNIDDYSVEQAMTEAYDVQVIQVC